MSHRDYRNVLIEDLTADVMRLETLVEGLIDYRDLLVHMVVSSAQRAGQVQKDLVRSQTENRRLRDELRQVTTSCNLPRRSAA